MKINSGHQKIGQLLGNYQKKDLTGKKLVLPWQALGKRICDELRIPKADQKLIYKICYENPEPYVEHCFNETKELAKDLSKAGHYFVKLIYKKTPSE